MAGNHRIPACPSHYLRDEKMREIKFRAWDKDQKLMLDNVQAKQGYLFRDFLNNQRFELMQYTGLKDWWEDDLLKSPDGRVGKIRYEERAAQYVVDCKDTIMGYFALSVAFGWQKIGNIHEKPDLIQTVGSSGKKR